MLNIESCTIIGAGEDTVNRMIESVYSTQHEYYDVHDAEEKEEHELEEKGTCRLKFDATMFSFKTTQTDLYKKYKYYEYREALNINSVSLSRQHGDKRISVSTVDSVVFVMCKNHWNYMKTVKKFCTHIGLRMNKLVTDENDCIRAMHHSLKIRATFEMMPQIVERFEGRGLMITQCFEEAPKKANTPPAPEPHAKKWKK